MAYDIHQSEWAKELMDEVPKYLYDRAIKMVQNPDFSVWVHKSTELGPEAVWAIESTLDPGFWMDTRKTKRGALALCKKMKWKVIPIT